MKVVYNWLKDFVEVTAAPQELASREHRWRRNRPSRGRHRRRSQFQSPRLPRPLRNRPRSRHDLQAPAEIYRAEARGIRREGRRRRRGQDRITGSLRPLHRSCHSKREDPAFPEMAERPPRSCRRRQHQQRRRYFELRDARARPPTAHFRLRQSPRSQNRRPPREA